MACTLAESPSDPFHRELRQLRCLRHRLDCYRVERTSSRAGVAPAEVQRLSRRTVSPTILRNCGGRVTEIARTGSARHDTLCCLTQLPSELPGDGSIGDLCWIVEVSP